MFVEGCGLWQSSPGTAARRSTRQSPPANRAAAERILDVFKDAEEATEYLFYDESERDGKFYNYNSRDFQLFQGGYVADNLRPLYWIAMDVAELIWEKWNSRDLPNPTLGQVVVLIQMREAVIESTIFSEYTRKGCELEPRGSWRNHSTDKTS